MSASDIVSAPELQRHGMFSQVAGKKTTGVLVIQSRKSKKVRVRSGWLLVRMCTCFADNKVGCHSRPMPALHWRRRATILLRTPDIIKGMHKMTQACSWSTCSRK